MSSILDKRNDLERFIREQTLGPGINGYRFADLTNRPLVEKDIRTLEPLSYEEEIINIVPAAVYSTGILFPEDKTGTNVHGVMNDPGDREKEDDEEVHTDVMDDIENKDTIELNQMFPKIMGFTCCLDEEILQHKQIAINLEARYYRKLDKKQPGYHGRYGLLCETDPVIFQDYLVKATCYLISP
ncbi:MAG: hypothetical protein LUH15_19700 [Tannerellaceae bacterium]|nr:hypothetical protein [Tannerellaceae bacterium]